MSGGDADTPESIFAESGRHRTKRVRQGANEYALRNPVQGAQEFARTSCNLAGVGSCEPGDRPHRTDRSGDRRQMRRP